MCKLEAKMMRRRFQPLAASASSEAETILRETAFVLRMTRRVKESILSGKPLVTTDQSSLDPTLASVEA